MFSHRLFRINKIAEIMQYSGFIHFLKLSSNLFTIKNLKEDLLCTCAKSLDMRVCDLQNLVQTVVLQNV